MTIEECIGAQPAKPAASANGIGAQPAKPAASANGIGAQPAKPAASAGDARPAANGPA